MKRWAILMAWCFSAIVYAEDATVTYLLMDGKTEVQTVSLVEKGDTQFLRIPKTDVPANVKRIDILHPRAVAKAGDAGFYVFCNGMYGEFKERPNTESTCPHVTMPIYGVKTPGVAMTVLHTGMRYETNAVVNVRDNAYKVFSRVKLEGDAPYDDIAMEYHLLPQTATYADMARVYRKFQLDNGVVKPLKERIQGRPELAYAANSMEVRVRLGWKPVPSPVAEQNAENEPPMKVVITFDRFMQIIDAFKKAGVNEAEFCLVGWNIGGHDGRYPQIFPVDPRLGGEAKLREAIQKAQKEGFQIVCHTNYSDAYRASQIGGRWDENYLLVRKDGQFNNYTTWGGGNMYETCPKEMFERFPHEDFPKLKDLGFRGLHYIDVFSTVNPRTCYSKEHPLTKEGYAFWTNKIFEMAQNEMGGLGSEGGFDYCISHLDYALYLSFYNPSTPVKGPFDRHVPFWQLVYNGIVLNNPYTACTNYTIKDRLAQLKLVEFGGRPMFYFYSKFKSSGSNWMGDADIRCGDEKELADAIAAIQKGYQEFQSLKHLQYEFMESHDKLADDVFLTKFSDGTRIVTNYRNEEFSFEGKTVPAMDYLLLK
ncbi:MAG: DUF5696 domain-containing protein [Planctomycetia bacterium]|nr:DUF5696 domain-containing protein [Planctomycetia bacterium]